MIRSDRVARAAAVTLLGIALVVIADPELPFRCIMPWRWHFVRLGMTRESVIDTLQSPLGAKGEGGSVVGDQREYLGIQCTWVMLMRFDASDRLSWRQVRFYHSP